MKESEAEKKLGVKGDWMEGWFSLGKTLTETAGKVGRGVKYD